MGIKQLFVSIIVPAGELNKYALECIDASKKLDYENFEIILLPDKKPKTSIEGIDIISTGNVTPAEKKNIGIKNAKGDICAFLDSDAYPDENWLKNAMPLLDDTSIGVLGGPNLTPAQDSFYQKLSGEILAKKICSGKFADRYKTGNRHFCLELPSCNFFARKKILEDIGGFNKRFLTAEDADLCFRIRKKNMKILYSPSVIVYHHRRPLFLPHARQFWRYGQDKAGVIKRDFTFDKLYYFIPVFFLAFISAGAFSLLFSSLLKWIYISFTLLYFLLLLTATNGSIKKRITIFTGIILTHFSYAFGFVSGLLKRFK
ncbi:glycosyltransferase [bacterium]|nr:glycosyltransferase [bacterium]